jgi:hypothetical protein
MEQIIQEFLESVELNVNKEEFERKLIDWVKNPANDVDDIESKMEEEFGELANLSENDKDNFTNLILELIEIDEQNKDNETEDLAEELGLNEETDEDLKKGEENAEG